LGSYERKVLVPRMPDIISGPEDEASSYFSRLSVAPHSIVIVVRPHFLDGQEVRAHSACSRRECVLVGCSLTKLYSLNIVGLESMDFCIENKDL